MKKTVLFFLLLGVAVQSAKAQFSENHAIYLSSDFSLGNYTGGDLSLNYVFEEEYSIRLGTSGYFRKAASQPEDFEQGHLNEVLTFGLAQPRDLLTNYYLTVGKIITLNSAKTIRLNLAVGLAYTVVQEPTNWKYVDTSSYSDNYDYDENSYSTGSLLINPKIEFPFTRYFGFHLSPMLLVNKDRVMAGIGSGVIIGLLRGSN